MARECRKTYEVEALCKAAETIASSGLKLTAKLLHDEVCSDTRLKGLTYKRVLNFLQYNKAVQKYIRPRPNATTQPSKKRAKWTPDDEAAFQEAVLTLQSTNRKVTAGAVVKELNGSAATYHQVHYRLRQLAKAQRLLCSSEDNGNVSNNSGVEDGDIDEDEPSTENRADVEADVDSDGLGLPTTSTHSCVEAAEKACREAFSQTCSFACCCCERRLFKHSVVEVTDTMYDTLSEVWATNLAGWVARTGIGHICHTCLNSIRRDRCPRFAVDNGLGFPDVPVELQGIPELAERLIARRIIFLQLRRLPAGHQHGLRGSVVNVPVDLTRVQQMLPRHLDDSETVLVGLKRKLQYKRTFMRQMIQPQAVLGALRYLARTPLYHDAHMANEEEWLSQFDTGLSGRKGTYAS
ncbi:hypothetical protein Agub_g12707 [Astrephomene gubernaculifera]|uniref:DUF6570 domain-containing protein n=2 Tax=Astrephomene gubernaculifera TaxID=47775 RepID=A0AAD3DYX0_9CHLO|nr:hypothetical protein Agub_g12707 [Astrephomene gubernaculifera]